MGRLFFEDKGPVKEAIKGMVEDLRGVVKSLAHRVTQAPKAIKPRLVDLVVRSPAALLAVFVCPEGSEAVPLIPFAALSLPQSAVLLRPAALCRRTASSST